MSIFTAVLFVFALSSCGGGATDACSCQKDALDFAKQITEAGDDADKVKSITEKATKRATDCATAALEDADAWAKALEGCE